MNTRRVKRLSLTIINRLNELNELLVKDGRIDDLKKAIVDEIYREKLYEEYHLSL